ncbi:NAD(P)/FAD-dependent oxidoreductase [Jatrophihabitans sp.]|jgi:FADH2 O2-dependent halogenase|uniref:NAD(P)/FAD-dependent oxidoreductase n=1 Tax=Jatrophihabitans sp. TaxID=1932789 RepID=UPI002F18367B
MHNAQKRLDNRSAERHSYDVAVLGSGLAGSIIAACLARNGARVVVLDTGTHPRFSIGESTTPYAAMMFRLIGERYGVPEVKYLASFESAQAKISSTVGRKRNAGFVYQRPGLRQNPSEATMSQDSALDPTQTHLYRQDVDAWLSMVAVRHGATLMQQQRLTGVDLKADGIRIHRADKDPIHAKYVVDTVGGHGSVLSDSLGVRQQPPRFQHQSRLLYSHLLDVRPYDEIATSAKYENPGRWHDGTLHHVFPGGWLWVIPFNNHGRGPNPLCSVGVSLDPRVHPARDCSPEQEFNDLIERFPDVKAQFAGARIAREWARIDQVQHSCERTVGDRWCLTGDAAGYLDPLMTGGLSRGLETTHALVHRLLAAITDDDFSTERFRYVEELEQGLLDYNDELYAGAYTATTSYPLWNAWYQYWATGQQLAGYELSRCYAEFLRSRDTSALAAVEEPWWRARGVSESSPYHPTLQLFRYAGERLRAVAAGTADPDVTAAELLERLHRSPVAPPVLDAGRLHRSRIDPAVRRIPATLAWARQTGSQQTARLSREGEMGIAKLALRASEHDRPEMLRNAVAKVPFFGRRYRVPTPR